MQHLDQNTAQEELIDWSKYDLDAAEIASPEEVFYLEWAQESVKKTTPYLNEFLQKLITLIVALIGAVIVATDKKLIPENWGANSAIVLLLSLVFALVGIWPVDKFLPMNCAKKIERIEEAMVSRKARWVRATLVTVGIALAMIIWGSLLCPSHSASK